MMENPALILAIILVAGLIVYFVRSEIEKSKEMSKTASNWEKWFQATYPEVDASETVVGPGAYMFSKGIPRIVFLRSEGEIHLCNLDQSVDVFSADNLLDASVTMNVTTTLSSTTRSNDILLGSVGVGQSKTSGQVSQQVNGVWLKLTVDDPHDPIRFIRFFNEERADRWLAMVKILLKDHSRKPSV